MLLNVFTETARVQQSEKELGTELADIWCSRIGSAVGFWIGWRFAAPWSCQFFRVADGHNVPSVPSVLLRNAFLGINLYRLVRYANSFAIGVPWSVMCTGRSPAKRFFCQSTPVAAQIVVQESGTQTGLGTMRFACWSV